MCVCILYSLYTYRVRRGVDREREVLGEHNRTLHAMTVSRTLDYIFHESRYDPKFRLVTENIVFIPIHNPFVQTRV